MKDGTDKIYIYRTVVILYVYMSSTHTSAGWLVGLEYKFENHWAGSGGDQCYSQDDPQTFIKEVGCRWQNSNHFSI